MMKPKELITLLRYRKPFILWVSIIAVILGLLFCALRPTEYRSSLLLQVSPNQTTQEAFKNIPGFDIGMLLRAEQLLLTSHRTLFPVIQHYQLSGKISPVYCPVIGELATKIWHWFSDAPAPAIFGLNQYSWGNDAVKTVLLDSTAMFSGQTLTIEYMDGNRFKVLDSAGKVLLANGITGRNYLIVIDSMKKVKLNIESFQARPGVQFTAHFLPNAQVTRMLRSHLTIVPVDHTYLLKLYLTGSQPIKTAKLLNAIAVSAHQQSQLADLEIIDPAIPSQHQNHHNLIEVILFFWIVGLVVALLLILIWQYFRQALLNPKLLTKSTSAPLLCSIHHHPLYQRFTTENSKHFINLFSEIDPNHLNVENLRLLRTHLFIKHPKQKPLIITNTSPNPGAGTSMISANLAQVIADAGKSVVLIDADLRHGHLHQYFDIADRPGLSDVLTGESQLNAVIKQSRFERLSVMARGSLPLKRAELLLKPEFEQLMYELGKSFEVIIFDLPPVLTNPEALLVMQRAHFNLMTACAIKTSHKMLERVSNRLQNTELNIHGCIFNHDFLY